MEKYTLEKEINCTSLLNLKHMKTKLTFVILALLAPIATFAQTVVNRTYPVKAGQQLSLKFDYPVVRISTWDKNEVAVTAKVSINGGDHDDAFTLQDQTNNGTLEISSKIKENLPAIYSIRQNGKKTFFKTEEEFKAYKNQNGIQSYSHGTDIDVKLEIKVPAHLATTIKSIYGMVELVDFNAPINVDAKYGGIDASLSKSQIGQIKATTNYGRIYSNLDLVLTDKKQENFLTSITAEPGKGPAYIFESTYGKIYLRKQ